MNFYYSIHRLVVVKSNVSVDAWNFFSAKSTGQPVDLEVEFLPDKPEPKGFTISGRNFAYSLDRDTFFFFDKWLGFPVSFIIWNLRDPVGKIKLGIFDPARKFLKVRPPRLSIDHLLRALVHLLLLRKDFTLTHAACVRRKADGRGLLLVAPSFSGKTITTLQLAKGGGYDYLSDDMTVIDAKGNAFAYPIPVNASYDAIQSLFDKTDRATRAYAAAEKILQRIIPEPILYPRRWIHVEDRLPIATTTHVDTVCLMGPGPEGRIEVSKREALIKMLLLNKGELLFFEHPILLAYAYFNSDFGLDQYTIKHEKVISGMLDSCERTCYLSASNPKLYPKLIESIG